MSTLISVGILKPLLYVLDIIKDIVQLSLILTAVGGLTFALRYWSSFSSAVGIHNIYLLLNLLKIHSLNQVIWCSLIAIIVPTLLSGFIRKRNGNVSISSFLIALLTSPIRPIELHFELITANYLRKKLLVLNDVIMAPNYEQILLKIQNIEQELLRHLRLQSGIETMFQVTINTILLLYAHSLTRTTQGLAALFDQDAFVFLGITVPSSIILAVLLALNLVGLSMAQYNGIVDQKGHLYQSLGKLMLLIGCCCAIFTRIMSFTLYFAPTLGLFNLLHHYQCNQTTICSIEYFSAYS